MAYGFNDDKSKFDLEAAISAAIEALGLDVSTGTVTRSSGASQIASSALRKTGHVVQLTMNGVTLAEKLKQWTSSPTAATIPIGFRPEIEVVAATSTEGILARITSDGRVMYRNSANAGDLQTSESLAFTATYIVN